LYYILKQKRIRKHYSEKWQTVSLYDSEDYFRGQAIFETLSDAKSYKKKYNERIQTRKDLNRYDNQNYNYIKLRIFSAGYVNSEGHTIKILISASILYIQEIWQLSI
jgi:hypothetical protein